MHADFVSVVMVVIVVAANVVFVSRRSRTMLDNWASRNSLALVKSSWAFFRPMSMWLTTSRNQMVYRITVRDHAGRTRSGWARCGNWLVGLWSDDVDVFWDDSEVHWS